MKSPLQQNKTIERYKKKKKKETSQKHNTNEIEYQFIFKSINACKMHQPLKTIQHVRFPFVIEIEIKFAQHFLRSLFFFSLFERMQVVGSVETRHGQREKV